MVLCAQALESARILLNSSTRDHANGLANSSGVLGHYLMDHHVGRRGAFGAFPTCRRQAASMGGPNRPNGIYVIRFRNTLTSAQQKDFIRGYGFQGGGGSRLQLRRRPGSAPPTRRRSRQASIGGVYLGGFGETLARFENSRRDRSGRQGGRLGHPGAQDRMTFGDNELAMMKDMAATAAEMIEAAGAKDVAVRT